MKRERAPLCPVPGCGGRREHWQAVCRACWKLLPADHRRAIDAAHQRRARHDEARAAIAAVAWLCDHMPAAQIARRVGDVPP